MTPNRHRRAGTALAAIALAVPCSAVLAASQLFKCIEGGRTVYQQQACSASSEPAPSAARPAPKESAAEAASTPSRPSVRPPSPASAASATRRR